MAILNDAGAWVPPPPRGMDHATSCPTAAVGPGLGTAEMQLEVQQQLQGSGANNLPSNLGCSGMQMAPAAEMQQVQQLQAPGANNNLPVMTTASEASALSPLPGAAVLLD